MYVIFVHYRTEWLNKVNSNRSHENAGKECICCLVYVNTVSPFCEILLKKFQLTKFPHSKTETVMCDEECGVIS